MAITCALSPKQIEALYIKSVRELKKAKEQNIPFDHNAYMQDLFNKIAEKKDVDTAAKFIQQAPLLLLTAAVKPAFISLATDLNAIKVLANQFTNPETGLSTITNKYSTSLKKLKSAAKQAEENLNSIILQPGTDVIVENQYLPTIATSTSFYQLAPFTIKKQEDPLARRVEDPNRAVTYKVLENLKEAKQKADGTILYNGTELYLKASLLSNLPQELLDETTQRQLVRNEVLKAKGKAKRATADKTTILVLTDKEGNYIPFTENGEVSETSQGVPVFQFLRNVKEVNGELVSLDPFGEKEDLASPEEIAALTKSDPEVIREQREKELRQVKALNDAVLKGEEPFVMLAGISEGVPAPLIGNSVPLQNIVKAYPEQKNNIFSSIESTDNGGSTVQILGDLFTMDRPMLSPAIIEEIASALTSTKLSDAQKKAFYKQFYPENVKMSDKAVNHSVNLDNLTFYFAEQTYEQSKANFRDRAQSINSTLGNLTQDYLKSLTPEQRNAVKAQIVKSLTEGSSYKDKFYPARFPIIQETIAKGYFQFNIQDETLVPGSYPEVILAGNPKVNTAYLDNDRTYNSYFIFSTNTKSRDEIANAVAETTKSQIRKAKDDLYEYLRSKSLVVDVDVRYIDQSASNQNERLTVENPLTNEDLITVVKERSDEFLDLEVGDIVTVRIIQSGMEGFNEDFPTAIGIYKDKSLIARVAETDFKAKEAPRKPLSKAASTEIKKANAEANTLDNIDSTPQPVKPKDKPKGDDPDTSINIFDRSILLDNNVTEAEIKAAEKWWKSSPLSKFIKLDPAFKIVNSDAYARFVTYGAKLMSDGKFGEIQIHPSGSFVDVYHEAWHGFSQLFLTKDQKKELYDEVKNSNPKYKDYTYFQIEELLAEDFRSYAKSPKAKPNSPKRNTIFRKIFNFLRTLFGLNKKGQGITQETYSSDLLEIPRVKELFETLYFADKNSKDPNKLLRNYTPLTKNVMFDKLDRGIEKIGKSKEDALSKSDSDLVVKSIDSIISQFIDEQASNFGSKSTSLAYFSEEVGKESGVVPKDVLYNVVRKRLEERLTELQEEYGKDIQSPLKDAKTLKDVEKASIGVIKSKEGNDKYIFLSSQISDFTNLELSIKKGNKAKGRSYFGIDIVTDFYRLKTVKNKNKKSVDIIIASDRDAAVAQYENYKRGGAKEFESITFKQDTLEQTPTLSPKQERTLNKIKILEKALENWGDKKSGVVKYHAENSTFDVARQVYTEIAQFDNEGNEIDESESLQKSPGESYADTTGTKSLIELADKETVYAIKSLFKIVNGKQVLNELGFPELVDFRSTWNVIARDLAGITDRQMMYDKLVEISKSYPEIKQLIQYKLPSPQEINSKKDLNSRLVNYEFNISNSFWQTFSKARVPILNNVLFVTKDKQGNVSFESKLLRSIKENPIILSNFKTEFKSDRTNPYVDVTKEGTVLLNPEKVLADFKGIDSLTGDKKLKFVRSLGFYIDDLKVIKKELELNSKYYGLSFIYNVVAGVNKIDINPNSTTEQRDFSLKFKLDPISALQEAIPKGILPNFKDEVKQTTQVNRLAELQASKGTDSANFSSKNAAGNKMYELMEQFTISKIIGQLNDLEKLNDAWDNTGTNPPKLISYLDPAKNSFTLRSQSLNSVFELDSPLQDFTRRNVKAKLALEYLGGTAVEGIEDAFGSETTKLDPSSYVLQQLHTMLKGGITEFIRHASKSASFGMRVEGVPIKGNSILKEASNLYVDISMFKDKTALDYAVENIFIPYIAVEFDRINKFKSDPSLKNIAGYNKAFYYKGKEQLNGESFLAFDDVLTEDTLDWLYSKATGKDLSIDIIAEINNPENSEIKSRIFSDIKSYFNNQTLQNLELLNEVPAIDQNLLAKADNITNLAAAFTMNSWIHNFETIHLFYGDMAQYDYIKDDLFKRNTGSTSNGPGFLNDKGAHDFINNVFNKNKTYAHVLAREAIKEGNIDLANEYLNNMFSYNGILGTAVIEETVRPESVFYSEIEEGLREDYTEQFSRLGLSKAEIKKRVDERVKEDMRAYSGMEEGDGAGYITFDTYRTLKKLENDWSDPQENLYQKIINNAEVSKDEVTLAFPAYKLQNFGPLAYTNLPAMAMHKFALFPIIPSVYKTSELEKLHKQMLKKNIQYVTFASGSKVASISKDGNPDKIYADEDKKQLLDDIEFTPNFVHIESLKKATAVGAKLKGKIKEPTQKKGILIDNLFDNGVITKPELQKPYDDFKFAVDDYSETLKVAFLDEIGFKYNSKTGQYTGDLEKLLKTFQLELERRDVPEHLIEFLGVDLKGNLINDLSLHLEADTIEKIILAVIQKRLIDQVTNGEALVQMPNSMMNGLWDTKLKLEKDPKKIKSLMGSNTLPFYERTFEIINGKKVYGRTKPMKIAIALQGDFYKLLELEYKGKKIGNIDTLNEAIKDEEWLKENSEAVTLSGARIPIQKHNSLEFAQVWHFLDPAAANTVIVPTELVAKAGSDFDVDKIFWNFPNLDNEGKFITESVSTKEIERRLNSTNREDKKGLKALIENKKKAAQNNLIKSMIGILERPEMYASLVRPNGTYIMKNLADELEEVATEYNRFDVVHGKQRTYKDKSGKVRKFASPTRALEVRMNAYKFQVNLEGKDSLGIVANQNKQSPIYKSVGAKLPESFAITYWNNAKQEYEEVGEVFLPYSVRFDTNKIGNNISLSGNFSQDGERIADIYDHMMNGLLDIEKDAWVFFLQTNNEMINTLNTLIEMGIPKRDVVWFVSQPISREYVKLQKRYKSAYNAAITGEKITDSKAKRLAAETLLARKINRDLVSRSNTIKLKHITKTLSDNTTVEMEYVNNVGEVVKGKAKGKRIKEIIKEVPTSSIKSIVFDGTKTLYEPITQKNILSSSNVYYLDEVLNEGKKFKYDDLKKTINNSSAENQMNVLVHLLSLESQLKAWQNYKRNNTPDTKRVKTTYQMNKKENAYSEDLESSKLDQETIEKLRNDSVLSSFNISSFALDIVEPLFNLRMNPVITNFIGQTLKNQRKLVTQNGFPRFLEGEEMFTGAFSNAVVNFIFQNSVSNFTNSDGSITSLPDVYKGKDVIIKANVPNHVQITEDKIFVDQQAIKKDYADKVFERENNIPNNYKERGLKTFRSAQNIFPTETSFVKFVVEREYLRSTTTAEAAKSNPLYKRIKQLLGTRNISDEVIFEAYLAQKSLINSYNRAALMKMRDVSYTDLLMNLIETNKDALSAFPVIQQIYRVENPSLVRRGLRVLSIKNKSEATGELADTYENNLRQLADPSIKKVADEELNKYISQMFQMFPLVATYQHGVGYSMAGMPKILPINGYLNIMKRAEDMFLNNYLNVYSLASIGRSLLEKENGKFTKGYKNYVVEPAEYMGNTIVELPEYTDPTDEGDDFTPKGIEDQIGVLEEELYALETSAEAVMETPDYIIARELPLITPESAQKETGGKAGIAKDIAGGLLSKENGLTVKEAAHQIWQENFFDDSRYDTEYIRNVIIDILTTGKTAYINNLMNTDRIKDLKRQIADLKAQKAEESPSQPEFTQEEWYVNLKNKLQELYPEIELKYTNETIDEINDPDILNQQLMQPRFHSKIVSDLVLPLKKAEAAARILRSKDKMVFLSTAMRLVNNEPLKYLTISHNGYVQLNISDLAYDVYKEFGDQIVPESVKEEMQKYESSFRDLEKFEKEYQSYLDNNAKALATYQEKLDRVNNLDSLTPAETFNVLTTTSIYNDPYANPPSFIIKSERGDFINFSYDSTGKLANMTKAVKKTITDRAFGTYSSITHETIEKNSDLWIDGMVALKKFKADKERMVKAINVLIKERIEEIIKPYQKITSREDFYNEAEQYDREIAYEAFSPADILFSGLQNALTDVLIANNVTDSNGNLTRSFGPSSNKLLELTRNKEYTQISNKKKKIENILNNKEKFNNDYDKYEDLSGDSDVLAPMPGWFLNAVSVASNGKYFDEIRGLFASKVKLFVTMNAQKQYDALMDYGKTPDFQVLADTNDINSLLTDRINFVPSVNLSNDIALLNQKEKGKIIGQANLKAMTVLIDAVNQKKDTLPHEYAHHYIAWYRNTPIVQEAIKKWGSEEALVQAIGEQVVAQKGEAYNWWQKFVKWILGKFDKLSTLDKEQLSKILTDAFLTRQDLFALTSQPQATLKRGGKIISDEDITRYNTYLSKSNGVKPKEFFTGNTRFSVFYNNDTGKRGPAPHTSKWILQDDGYYDLIDKESGEVYIENVDLQTGYKFDEPLDGGFGTTETC